MVWLNRILLFFSIFFSQNLFSNNLNKEEEIYFNFIDLNNDNKLSKSEIDQTTNILFQLIDFNQDGYISQSEINELKNIVDSLR